MTPGPSDTAAGAVQARTDMCDAVPGAATRQAAPRLLAATCRALVARPSAAMAAVVATSSAAMAAVVMSLLAMPLLTSGALP